MSQEPVYFLTAAGLRTPLAVPGPYPAPFGMVPHAGMNGELTSPGAAYAGLHNMSPQMSAAAAAAAVVAYGRSPMVSGIPGKNGDSMPAEAGMDREVRQTQCSHCVLFKSMLLYYANLAFIGLLMW